ncbi:MAG TPA: TonB-dependent receptor [Alloacidobacterium sp.]|nr:TonB-dependent receptor [Alloacidobacterium sp.]
MRRLIHVSRRMPVCTVIATFVFLLALFSSAKLHAQANAGITGTITDASGAVVAGANVTITNQSTGVQNHTVTSSAGTYAVTGLIPGIYSITVDAAGFKKNVQNGVHVEVSTIATIPVTLSTGSTSETVQVTASAIALNTTAPQLGSTIEPTVVKALPAEVSGRGRQIDTLQFMVPGTTGSAFSHRISGGVDFEQEIVYNGVPAPQPETEGYTTNFNPPYEMVDEFRVERTTFAAQFGLGQGVLTYQMASGTNKYHGDLFEINRNSFFDSVGFFNGKDWVPSNVHNTPPTDHENNYGFTIGGPISIPKLYDGRNRTFGHYSQEWYKQNNLNTNSSTVPTALEKTGDFSDFVDSDGHIIPIYDNIPGTPEYGQQFSYNGKLNVIPPSMLSPTSQSLLQYLPDPDLPGLDSNRSYAPFVNPHIQHVWGFTVDQVLTPKQNIHYSQWRNSFSNYSFDNNPFVIAPNPLNSMKYEPALGSGFLLTYDNAITPNLVATAGFGWIGEINNQFNQTRYSFPAIQQGIIMPYITWDGNHSLTDWGTQGSWLQSINRKLGIAIVNNYLWTKGRNTFNIGGEFRRSYQDDNEDQTEGGQFAFSQKQTSNPANINDGGSAFASYMLGMPNSANRSNSQELRLRNLDLSPYIQDDIKLTRKLTLNVGLRWDIQVPFTEVNNHVVFFDPDNTAPNPFAGNIPGIAQQLGTCSSCAGYNRADIHWGHVGPRLGFAYQVSDKTVVQAGFAVAFLNGGAYEYGTNKVAVNYGNLLVGSYTQGQSGSQQSSFGSWDVNTMPNPQPTPYSQGLGIGTQINAFSKTKDGFAPYSQQWNVNIQHQAPWNVFLTAAWVGNRVIHLPSNLNRINQFDPKYLALGNDLNLSFADGSAQAKGYALPYPTFVQDFGGSATVAQSLAPFPQYSNIMNNFEGSGTTYYEGLQVEAEKRFSNGLSFLAGWTLSRLWDNTSSGFTSFTAGAVNKYNQKPEWGVSTSDEPNTLKVSGTYELPIGPGKTFLNNKGVSGQLLGGWQLSWILDYEAGTANGPGENGTPFPPNGGNRPDRNTSVKLSTASYQKVKDQFEGKTGPAQVWQANSFTPTSQFVLGNATRTYSEMRNPAFYNENANIRKHFYLGERFQAILQFDYFNLFNRTQLNGPDTNASNSTFGQVTNKNAQSNAPVNRQGQISVRIEF